MKTKIERKDKAFVRKSRTRFKVGKNRDRLRLSVFRSKKHIYGQIIDIVTGNTILGISSKDIDQKDGKKGKTDISFKTGEAIAQKAKAKKIETVVFDRGGYKYHGRVKALADGARKGGLIF